MILMNIFIDPYNHDHVRTKHSIVNISIVFPVKSTTQLFNKVGVQVCKQQHKVIQLHNNLKRRKEKNEKKRKTTLRD